MRKGVNADNILVELREEIERVKLMEKWVSNVVYVMKGGVIFCGCLYVSNLFLSATYQCAGELII